MYLNCHTSLSFRYGTLSAEDLFAEARRCGVRKLVITEINNTASYIELARMARRPQRTQTDKSMNDAGDLCPEIAVGIEFRREGQLLYVGLAKNNAGFEELNRFLSFHNREGRQLPAFAPPFTNCYVIYPFSGDRPGEFARK